MMGRADLHVHPAGDPSTREHRPRRFLDRLELANLDVAVITDHDRVDLGSRLIREGCDRGLAVELVLGEEVSSLDGHVLALGLAAVVPPHRSLTETVARIHDQGGLAVVAHPLLPTRISVRERALARAAEGRPDGRPDAVEGFNPMANWLPGYGGRVARLAARLELPLVGGSDSHRARDVGQAWTRFEGRTFAALRAAILAGSVEADGSPYGLVDVARGVVGQVVEGLVRPGRG